MCAYSPAPSRAPLLEVDDLQVTFFTRSGTIEAVRGISLTVEPGETVALVGESGSGKSVTAQAILGLTELPGRITGGDIRWKGESVLRGKVGRKLARSIRGKDLAVVFQDPMTSLNPLFTVGFQIEEVCRHHMGMSKQQARERAIELLDLVGITTPSRRIKQYPHEFSGGMRQRVMIAMALACEPELLIADEPTTALDVTIQAQVLDLLSELQQRLGLAVLMITHDLGVVAGLCHRVEVMYAGKLVEGASAAEFFATPAHPYSGSLLGAIPRLDRVERRLPTIAGAPPDLRSPSAGCAFRPRCDLAMESCGVMPPLTYYEGGRHVACWRITDLPDPRVIREQDEAR